MFNDSYLRACMILRFVKKLDFAFLSLDGPSHGARVWCLGAQNRGLSDMLERRIRKPHPWNESSKYAPTGRTMDGP